MFKWLSSEKSRHNVVISVLTVLLTLMSLVLLVSCGMTRFEVEPQLVQTNSSIETDINNTEEQNLSEHSSGDKEEVPENNPQTPLERYYRYFADHPSQVNPLIPFPSSDEDILNENLMVFAIYNLDHYSYENGNTTQEIDTVLMKYFGRSVSSYITRLTEMTATGNVRATGWSFHGANRLVLTNLTINEDDSYTGTFDVYYIAEAYEHTNLIDSALFQGNTESYDDLYKYSVVIRFEEIADESEKQGFYIRYHSIEFPQPEVSYEVKPDPIYDTTTYLTDEEVVTADGVRLTMTYDEVLSIIGEPEQAFDNSDTVKSFIKNGIHYGFYQIDKGFDANYPLPRDGVYYLLNLTFLENYKDPLPRGIRIGDDIADVFDKFPTLDKTLRKWAYQTVYGEQQRGQPHAFLEFTTVLGRYRLYATTTTQVLNIHFDKKNKVMSVDLILEK